MQPLFQDHRAPAFALIFTLLAFSVLFATRPTGMVTSVSSSALVDAAFKSDAVRSFAERNPDFSVSVDELTESRTAYLKESYPQLYKNLPDARIYQMILDAGDKAMIILLDGEAVFKTWETITDGNLG